MNMNILYKFNDSLSFGEKSTSPTVVTFVSTTSTTTHVSLLLKQLDTCISPLMIHVSRDQNMV